jgi:hypothetical protein
MFPAPDGKTFEPYKIRSRKKETVANGVDVEMADATDPSLEGNDGEELVEDPDDDEGAIYPLKGMLMRSIDIQHADDAQRVKSRICQPSSLS